MITAYVICAIAGGLFVLVGALSGLGDHDAEGHLELDGHGELDTSDAEHSFGDADSEHEFDGHGDAQASSAWLPFLSLRFWTYGLTAFGVTGLALTWVGGSAAALTAGLAVATGLVAGTGMAAATRWLRRSQIHSGAREGDFSGALGRVLAPVRQDSPGKIRCEVRGELIDLIALGADDELLTEGTEVVVLEYNDSRATVAKTRLGGGLKTLPSRKDH